MLSHFPAGVYAPSFLAIFHILTCVTIYAAGLRLATSQAETPARPFLGSPVFTPLSRFDADSWSRRHTGPFSMSTSDPAAMPGTAVSSRQMLALQIAQATNFTAMSAAVGINQLRKRTNTQGCSGGACSIVQKDEIHRPLGVLRLQDLFGTEYVGEISVGTRAGVPQARLQVIYDTGSTDLWVLSDLCRGYPCNKKEHHVFNHGSSDSFRESTVPQQLSTSYGSGEIHGRVGFDEVQVGPLVAKGQMLGLISEEVGVVFGELDFDGLVGLGFPSLISATGPHGSQTLPLFDNLMKQGNLETPWFAFYLHSDPRNGGAVLWGGVDERLYHGPLSWFPVVEEAYWSLDIIAFRIGDQSFAFGPEGSRHSEGSKPLPKPLLVVDSGTTYYTAPTELFSAISSLVSVRKCKEIGSLPSMVFTLKNAHGEAQDIKIHPNEYMVQNPRFADVCLPAIVAMDFPPREQPVMIVGEVFMRHYFTVFSRGRGNESSRVGLARSREDSTAASFFETRLS